MEPAESSFWPHRAAAQQWSLRLSFVCGALPLLLGTSAYALWRATSLDIFQVFGIVAIYVGVALVTIGGLALIPYLWLAFKLKNLSVSRVFCSTLGSLCLLLVNFPVAGACVVGAIHYETRYRVEVCNDSEKPMSRVRVYGAGTDEFIGIVEPGESATVELWFDRDGTLEVFVSKACEDEVVLVSGYVCRLMGGDATVTLGHDDQFTVTYER